MEGALAHGLAWAAGLAVWPLFEYTVHGFLSHRLRTPISPLHQGHHRSPERVFTTPLAWMPIAAFLWLGLAPALGAGLAAAAVAGLLTGFLHYEYIHWRIHFREPAGPRQERLRAHHLSHHFVNPRAYFGVSVRWTDRLFGSLPERWRDDYHAAARRPPLTGPSNFGSLLPPGARGAAPPTRARTAEADRDPVRCGR